MMSLTYLERVTRATESRVKINHPYTWIISSNFFKKWVGTGNFLTDNKNIHTGSRNGIRHWKMMKSGKRKKWKELNCQMKESSTRLERRKVTRTWEYWKWTPLNKQRWTKKLEKVPQTNEKSFHKPSLQQKSHDWDKRLSSPSCKILKTIHKLEKGRTQTNERKDKKIDHWHGFTSFREHWQTVFVSRRRKRTHQK